MIFLPFIKQLRKRREAGQAYIEFIVIFPLLVLLFLFIAAMAWYWWNQMAAAEAIRAGTAMAGHHEGGLDEGYLETYRALSAPLGGYATDYEGTVTLRELGEMRAMVGHIKNERVIDVPWIGPLLFTVEAHSFQRKEQFYGGRPETWE